MSDSDSPSRAGASTHQNHPATGAFDNLRNVEYDAGLVVEVSCAHIDTPPNEKNDDHIIIGVTGTQQHAGAALCASDVSAPQQQNAKNGEDLETVDSANDNDKNTGTGAAAHKILPVGTFSNERGNTFDSGLEVEASAVITPHDTDSDTDADANNTTTGISAADAKRFFPDGTNRQQHNMVGAHKVVPRVDDGGDDDDAAAAAAGSSSSGSDEEAEEVDDNDAVEDKTELKPGASTHGSIPARGQFSNARNTEFDAGFEVEASAVMTPPTGSDDDDDRTADDKRLFPDSQQQHTIHNEKRELPAADATNTNSSNSGSAAAAAAAASSPASDTAATVVSPPNSTSVSGEKLTPEQVEAKMNEPSNLNVKGQIWDASIKIE